MSGLGRATETTDLVLRMQRVLLAIDLDCRCRTRLGGALNRFTSLEHRRRVRKSLSDAREQKGQIIARLAFLAELDEITDRESDQTVFEEMALLFDEICASATTAAASIRLVSPVEETVGVLA